LRELPKENVKRYCRDCVLSHIWFSSCGQWNNAP